MVQCIFQLMTLEKDMGKSTRTKQIAVNKRVGVPDLTSLNDACTRYNMFDK